MIIETLLSKRDQLPLELAIIEPEGEAIGVKPQTLPIIITNKTAN